MIMPPNDPSDANFASEPARVSSPRKIAAWSIRATGFLLGAGFSSIYLLMAWVLPPDMSHAHPRTMLNFYLTGPLLLFFGPILLGRMDCLSHRSSEADGLRLGRSG